MLDSLKSKINSLVTDQKFSDIFTGSIWALSARVLAMLMGLVSSIVIARFYGPEVMGILAVVNSFLILTTLFTLMGTNTSILRLIPEHLVRNSPTSAYRVYTKTQYLVILASAIFGTLFFFNSKIIADKVFTKPHLSFYFTLASLFVIFKSLALFNTAAVRSLKRIRLFGLMQVLPTATNLIILVLLTVFHYHEDNPIYTMLAGIAITGLLGWFSMEYTFKKKIQPKDGVQLIAAKEILSISLPMLLSTAMTFVISQTGVIMLGIFKAEAEVGYYAIAVKLATLTTFILTAINTMVAPRVSELYNTGTLDDLFYVIKKSAKLIFWTTTPIIIGLLILGKPILSIVFGREFGVAYPALVLLIIAQFVNAISGSTGVFMNMTGNQNVFSTIKLIAALTNIGLNLLLIPTHGIYGAAFAAMFSLSFWNITTLIYIKLKFGQTTGYFPIFW